MSKKEYRKIPELIEMRLSEIAINKVGSRSDGFTTATILLDIDSYPSAWIGGICKGRWIVEPDIGSVKCTLGLEHLRGQSPEMLEREIWTAMLTYNLLRLKMLQSGYAAEQEIRSMSFTETFQVLSTDWLFCACVGINEALAISAQAQGVCAVAGNRSEPIRAERKEAAPQGSQAHGRASPYLPRGDCRARGAFKNPVKNVDNASRVRSDCFANLPIKETSHLCYIYIHDTFVSAEPTSLLPRAVSDEFSCARPLSGDFFR